MHAAYTEGMQARITRVAIRNYRSIASCDVELKPLTILAGPNDSGKSNFLDALRFLVHSMHAPLEQVVEARSGIRSILRKLPLGKIASSFSIAVGLELAEGSGTYSLTIGEGADGASVITDERCEFRENRFTWALGKLEHTTSTSPASTGDRPALVSFGSLPQFAPVFGILAGLTFYAPNTDKMRRPITAGPGKVLSRDASNAADVLALAPMPSARVNIAASVKPGVARRRRSATIMSCLNRSMDGCTHRGSPEFLDSKAFAPAQAT